MILDDGLSPLAAWRRYRGLSQAELAEKAGMSQTGVAALERRPNAQGRRSTRKALADALGITVSAPNPLTDQLTPRSSEIFPGQIRRPLDNPFRNIHPPLPQHPHRHRTRLTYNH